MNNLSWINAPTLERGWALAYEAVTRAPSSEITPLVVTIEDLQTSAEESMGGLRGELDSTLISAGKATTSTVANTLFPRSLWDPTQDRSRLYERYMTQVFPRIKRDSPRGTYFQRMINFTPLGFSEGVNQLEQIITTWTKYSNHRHSALQLSVFDPTRDHLNTKRLGFPCLHQVCFTPHGDNGCKGLSVTGFYATQHIWTKAYGNYLGLIRLGRFVAASLGIPLIQMTCFAGKASLGDGLESTTKKFLMDACSTASTVS